MVQLEEKSSATSFVNGTRGDGDLLVGGNLTIGNTLIATDHSGNIGFDTSTLYIDSANNRVGIGTTGPLEILHVSGGEILIDDGVPNDRLWINSNSGAPRIYQSTANSRTLTIDNAASGVLSLSVEGTGTFGTNAVISGSGNSYFNGGNVGIGTTNPGANLEVYSTSTADNGHLYLSGTPHWYMLSLGERGASAGAYGIGLTNTIDNRQMSFHVPNHAAYGSTGAVPSFTWRSNGAVELMNLESDSGELYVKGNVGIGTTAPTSKLYVSGNVYITGSITKGSGSFEIPHPDPVKKAEGYQLRHCFVESPTRGDNVYRWTVEVEGGSAQIVLPDYFAHLNENVQVWVSPVKHFGRGYGEANAELTMIDLKTDTDGIYNILAIGTRKDEVAREHFDELGVEFIRE